MKKTITHLTTRDELTCIDFNDVMTIMADGNYMKLILRSGRTVMLLAGLHDMENVARQTNNSFYKVGRSHVINLKYVATVNVVKRIITMADDTVKTSIDLNVSKEAVSALKHYMEKLEGEPIVGFAPSNSQMNAKVMTDS